jgi:sulfur relay (sulfurtransferase) complex TusBCD TusD component (DsrE family)
MSGYLLIASRDPFASADAPSYLGLAADLAKKGRAVTVFLVQNAVLGARRGARADGLASLAQAGVEVLADDFSLRERGIEASALKDGIRPAALDVVVDQLAEGRKALWY